MYIFSDVIEIGQANELILSQIKAIFMLDDIDPFSLSPEEFLEE